MKTEFEFRRKEAFRFWVHLALIATVVVSLVFEPILTIHIVIGLVFVVFVALHLMQRRRISRRLARRLIKMQGLNRRAGRLAIADAILASVTLGMLISGLWDWIDGHPTRIRWHALTGIALGVLLLVHTMRRWSRLRRSHIQ